MYFAINVVVFNVVVFVLRQHRTQGVIDPKWIISIINHHHFTFILYATICGERDGIVRFWIEWAFVEGWMIFAIWQF